MGGIHQVENHQTGIDTSPGTAVTIMEMVHQEMVHQEMGPMGMGLAGMGNKEEGPIQIALIAIALSPAGDMFHRGSRRVKSMHQS